MLKNRLLYLFILICTTAFFICFNGYYSWYIFLLSLALPWLSLLFSLPGMLTLWAAVEAPGPGRAGKSAPLPIQVSAGSRWPLPSGRIRLRLLIENTLTGETSSQLLELSPGRRPQAVEQKLTSHTCGRIVCRLHKARGYDLLGLFSLPVRLRSDSACQVIVEPNIFDASVGLGPMNIPDAEGERYSPTKPGSDPTELFGLRDYRPGDRLNRVDWKLSGKTGSMLVREASLPVARRALLLMDLSGDGLEADLLMDALGTLGHCLCGLEAEYVVGFPMGNGLAFMDADGPESGGAAIDAVLCHCERGPFPRVLAAGGEPGAMGELGEAPSDIARVVYICPEPGHAAIGFIAGRYPSARTTLIHSRPLPAGTKLPPDINPVRVQPGTLAADLEGLML